MMEVDQVGGTMSPMVSLTWSFRKTERYMYETH